MLPYKRVDRVKKLLHETISKIMYELKEPGIEVMVTLTDIEMSDDMEHAKIFYSFIGDKNKEEEIQKMFDKNKGFIRSRVGREIRLKKTPTIQFIYDGSYERAQKIFDIFNKLSEEKLPNK